MLCILKSFCLCWLLSVLIQDLLSIAIISSELVRNKHSIQERSAVGWTETWVVLSLPAAEQPVTLDINHIQ